MAVSPVRIIKEVNVTKSQLSKGKTIEEDKKDDNFSPPKKGEMEKEIRDLKAGLQKLTTAYERLFSELKKVQEKSDQLEEEQELLQEEVLQLRTTVLTNIFQKKIKKFNKVASNIKSRLQEEDLLEDLLEAQKEFSLGKSSFAVKLLEKYKNKLVRSGIREEEVKRLCEMKDELIRLEKEIEQQQLETRIEVINK